MFISHENSKTLPFNFFQEVRLRVGNKKIFHLEAWVVKVMSLYRVSLNFLVFRSVLAEVLTCFAIQHLAFDVDLTGFD